MSKIKQDKIPMTLEDDILKIAVEQGVIEKDFNWKLVRERDGLTHQSKDIKWIEFDEFGRFKDQHKDIGINRSLLMSPFNEFFTWQTTTVTKVLYMDETHIKFQTGNSTYDLYKL